MPLKVKAIIDAIKGTPLCDASLIENDGTAGRKSMYCVMGVLLRKVGATNKELMEIQDADSDDGSSGFEVTYWRQPKFQKFKPALKRKFGIASHKEIVDLVALNDGFMPDWNRETAVIDKDRTCHIMKTLVEREVKRIEKEQANV